MSERAKRLAISILALVNVVLSIIVFVCIDLQEQEHEEAMVELTQQITDLRDENELLSKQLDETEALIQAQTELINELRLPPEKPEPDKPNRGGDREEYSLTAAERDLVEKVIMAESGGEPYEGQVLVAQCILNACQLNSKRPAEIIRIYSYAKGRPQPSQSVMRAVEAVFDRGEVVESEPIIYFYAPGMVESKFHESQRFVRETGGHRFFAER